MKFKSVCLSPTNDHFPCAIDVIAAMQMGDGSTAGGQEKKIQREAAVTNNKKPKK